MGDGRSLRIVHIHEFAPDMGQTGNLADGAIAIQVFKPGITMSSHPIGASRQMVLRMFAFAVG